MSGKSNASIYALELNRQMLDNLRPVRTTWESITALMQAIEWFDVYPVKRALPSDSSNYFVYSKSLGRLFTSIDTSANCRRLKQIRSFSLPFASNWCEQEKKLRFFLHGDVIDARVTTTVIDVCHELQNESLRFSGIEGYIRDQYYYGTSDSTLVADQDRHISFVLEVIGTLLRRDVGYLRYDDDAEHERSGIHPRHHIDLFYSNRQSIKIAMDSEASFLTLHDFADQKTNAFILSHP